MKDMYGKEIDYRPLYQNGHFFVAPYVEGEYCITKHEPDGAFAAGRVVSDNNAFAVADIIGSIYVGAVYEICEKLEHEFGKAGRDFARHLKASLTAGFGLPKETKP